MPGYRRPRKRDASEITTSVARVGITDMETEGINQVKVQGKGNDGAEGDIFNLVNISSLRASIIDHHS